MISFEKLRIRLGVLQVGLAGMIVAYMALPGLVLAQGGPVIDSLAIFAVDSLGTIDTDEVYGPANNTLRFRLVYRGTVPPGSVRGALQLRGRLPHELQQDTVATWIFYGGPYIQRKASEGWSDSWAAIYADSLSIPVLNDGGFVEFVANTGKYELFQVSIDSGIVSADSPQASASNLRPTAIKKVGDELWVAGVFPGDSERGAIPRGFLARRRANESWESFHNVAISSDDPLNRAVITAISSSSTDVWFGTVSSGLLRYRLVDGKWFHYTAEKDSLAGNGIPVVAVESDAIVWIGVKDSLQVRGLERVQLRGDGIAVTHFGGIPLTRIPFPSTEIRAMDDASGLSDYVQVMLVDSALTVREVVSDATGINLDAVLFSPFPRTLRVPNPRNRLPDQISIAFPRSVEAKQTSDTTANSVVVIDQKISISPGDTISFPPATISFAADALYGERDNIPDSLEINWPKPTLFEVGGKRYQGIFLESKGSLRLQDTLALRFPQTVSFSADSTGAPENIAAQCFAESGNIKLLFTRNAEPDSIVMPLNKRGVRIPNPLRPPGDPDDYITVPMPDTVKAILQGTTDTVWVHLDSIRVTVGKKLLNMPNSLRFLRTNRGLADSLFIPFPAVLRIPNPGSAGAPDFEVVLYQPPEDSIITAIAVQDSANKWIGLGGSGLVRLKVRPDEKPDSSQWEVIPFAENSLRSSIVFDLQVEKADNAETYIWAGTDGGLLRLKVDAGLDAILNRASLIDSMQSSVLSSVRNEANKIWLELFRGGSQLAPNEQDAIQASITSDSNAVVAFNAEIRPTLDILAQHVEVFSSKNSQLPDNSIKKLALANTLKWVATSRGLASLEDDKTGEIQRWNIYNSQKYGGLRDSITAVEASGGSIWFGRLPTWYSDVTWNLGRAYGDPAIGLPRLLDKIKVTAYTLDEQNDTTSTRLKNIFVLDGENPAINSVGVYFSYSDTTGSDTLYYTTKTPTAEVFASLEDSAFGLSGIDTVRVYLNPNNLNSPEPESLVDTASYRLGENISDKAYSAQEDSLIKTIWVRSDSFKVVRADGSIEPIPKDSVTVERDVVIRKGIEYRIVGDTLLSSRNVTALIVATDTVKVWRVRRHNFSCQFPIGKLKSNSSNTLHLEVLDRAGNKSSRDMQFFAVALSQDSTEIVPVFANFPNPLRQGGPTFFYFVLNGSSEKRVNLRIFDLSGVLVNILVRNESRSPGVHREIWDGRDFFGQSLANGVYLCELEVGNEKRYTKAVIFR